MKKVRPRTISKPVTITMRPVYRKKANEIMARTGEKISELTRRLIREEWERRNLKKPERVMPAPSPADELPIVPFSDKTKRRSPGGQN